MRGQRTDETAQVVIADTPSCRTFDAATTNSDSTTRPPCGSRRRSPNSPTRSHPKREPGTSASTDRSTHQRLAECFGLLALIGLYLVQRSQSGTLGLVGFALNVTGFVGTASRDLASNWVFPYLPRSTVDALLAGPTGKLLLLASVVFLAGVIVFAIATWRARALPAGAMALYVLGLLPVALRTKVPAPGCCCVGRSVDQGTLDQ